MVKLEQAREALQTARIFIEDEYRDQRAEPSGEWLSPEAREPHRRVCEALASLSPTTPVYGVGAEPRVKPLEWGEYKALGDSIKTVAHDYFGNEFRRFDMRLKDIPQSEIDAAQADYERRILSALASPEAEARLRERVKKLERELEKARANEDDGLAWDALKLSQKRAAELEALIDGDGCPDPDKIGALFARAEAAEARLAQVSGRVDLSRERPRIDAPPKRTEARLAQAEGGPDNAYVGFGFDPRSNEEYPTMQAEREPAAAADHRSANPSAFAELTRIFHKTRLTKDITISADLAARLLGYDNGKRE